MVYSRSVDEVIAQFQTSVNNGLTSDQVNKNFTVYGKNRLPKKKHLSAIIVLFRQCLSPLMFVLLLAAVGSFFVGEHRDALVIAIAALINIIVGFLQEWKAERAAQALQKYESYECVVMRDGLWQNIDTSLLVPGDIVQLNEGKRIPADIRLIDTVSFVVEEAILTGESSPVTKDAVVLSDDVVLADRTNMVYMGTYALHGKAHGVVVATGLKTEFGSIAQLLKETKIEQTPIQLQLTRFSWFLGIVMFSIAAIIGLISYFRGYELYEIFSLAIALAVAAIPEGLLIAVTVVLAVGMQRMVKRNALIKRLIAAETLGSVSVICTDKTGTVTRGHLSIARLAATKSDVLMGDRIPDDIYDLLVMSVLNNDAQLDVENGNNVGLPLEIALLKGAQEAKISIQQKRDKFPRIAELPFSSDIKYMATLHQGPDTQRIIMKGAPEYVLKRCLDTQTSRVMFEKSQEMTKSGLRVIGVAFRDGESLSLKDDLSHLTFAGLIGFADMLRPQVAQTVEQLRSAGIRVVLVTGDHAKTAVNVAQGAHITGQTPHIIEGKELDTLSDEKLIEQIEGIDIFARVEPRHKVRIVQAWKAKNKFIAMTGDGVNDAPALRAANIGVALGSGSDLTHEVADMVLLDNNLETITHAVKQGRVIFDNLRKVIAYLLVDCFSEMMLIGGAILCGLPLPLLPVQILWINIISDGLPYLALTVEPPEAEIMLEKPRPYDEPLVNREMKCLVFLIGIITDLGLFGLFITLYWWGYELNHLRTIIFTGLAVDSLLYVFSVRSFRKSLLHINLFSNKWMIPAVFMGFLLQISTVYIPWMRPLFSTVVLHTFDWCIIGVLSTLKIVAIEIAKWYFIILPHQDKK